MEKTAKESYFPNLKELILSEYPKGTLTYDNLKNIDSSMEAIMKTVLDEFNVKREYIGLEKDMAGLDENMINAILKSMGLDNKKGGSYYKEKYLEYKNKYINLKSSQS